MLSRVVTIVLVFAGRAFHSAGVGGASGQSLVCLLVSEAAARW